MEHLDVNVHVLGTVWGIPITDSHRNAWILSALIIIAALIVRSKIKKANEIPRGVQNVIEFIVETFDKFVVGNMGKRNAHFAFLFFGVFVFIFISNMSGLFYMRQPTADFAFTGLLAFSMFFLFHIMGIKRKGIVGYLKFYATPNIVFVPITLIGEIARPVSLGFRLFGNIIGGFIVIEMIYKYLPVQFTIGGTVFLHIYFDIFAAFIQSFIFVLLSMTFLSEHMHMEESH